MVDRPRLVVVASTFPAHPDDGTPSFVKDLSLHLSQSFDTVVLVPRVPGAPREERVGDITIKRFRFFPRRWEDLADGAIIENLRFNRLRWLQVPPFLVAEAIHLRRLIRRHRPDVLHLHWLIPQGVPALAVARRVPWVISSHGADVYAMQGRFVRRLRRWILRRAAAVTACNIEARGHLLDSGADPETTHVQSVGADLAALKSLAGLEEPVAGRMLFVGRLAEKKGVAVLLDAVRRLPDDLPWSLTVVGDGPLRSELEQLASDLSSVTFTGALSRDQVAAAYARASIVVVPSIPAVSGDQDGLPTVLLEAMGLGRAIVASDLPGLNEAITHDHTGLLVPPGDPTALAEALTRVLRDSALRSRLGEAAEYRSSDYTLEVCAKRFAEILSAAAQEHT